MDFLEELQFKMAQMSDSQKEEFISLVEQYLRDQESSSSDQE